MRDVVNSTRWLGYLVVSFGLILSLAGQLEFPKTKQIAELPRLLKISLSSVAAQPPVQARPITPPPEPVAHQVEPTETFSHEFEFTAGSDLKMPSAPVQKVFNTTPLENKKNPEPQTMNKMSTELKPEPPKTRRQEYVVTRKPTPPVKIANVQQLSKAPAKINRMPAAPKLPQIEPKSVNQNLVAPAAKNLPDNAEGSSSVVREARYLTQTPPLYPSRSRELGQQGLVTVHAEVLPNGKPKTVRVEMSSGYRRLDLAALAAVKTWVFETAHYQGIQSSFWVRVPVRFVIN